MLPSPNLDDRDFEEIVGDVKRQIAQRCPEWTEHNVSDPGVTLIELFAWMMEMTLYRLNQVPDKNYVKFLDMLGVTLEPPAPATTDLRFDLSRPINDADGEEAFQSTLPARDTVAATVRTEHEEAIEFGTDDDLKMVRPRLAHIMAIPRLENEDETFADARDLPSDTQGFPIFSEVPRSGNALYLGFANDVSGNVIELLADCVLAAATGLDENYPAQVWEWWNGGENCWERLEIVLDTTTGWNSVGRIQMAMPHNLHPRILNSRRAYWVRCRYTIHPDDLPPLGIEQRRPSPYQRSPEIVGLQARTVGGVVPASHASSVHWQELGQSDGLPGQVFTLPQSPILPRRGDETIFTGEQGAPWDEFTRWTEVKDFSQSGPHDRHFICDSATGEVYFGPNIRQPDGAAWQYGSVPPKGHTIVFSAYRYGGGVRGNVKENQIRVLKSSIPYISGVTNPRRAEGGRDQETLEHAKMRGRAILRMRERAVTAEDYEFLAQRASAGVGRARCVQPRAVYAMGPRGEHIPPGVVKVLLVPALPENLWTPNPHDLRLRERVIDEVRAFLDERRLLTTVLEVDEPEYVFVSTDITLVADPRADADQVARRVEEKLNQFIHPLRGGPNGDGWPFRRTLTLADVYAQVQAASGVAFLLDAEIAVSRIINQDEGVLGLESVVANAEGVRLNDNELLCSREHRIVVRPMWSVGMEEPRNGAG